MKCEGTDSRRAGCLHELAESEGGDFSVLFFSHKGFKQKYMKFTEKRKRN